MQIFEHQNERRVGADGLHQLRQLAQHALSRRPLQLVLQDLPVARAEQPGHLY
jgi:hypothetical protein